jgi:hypothetical protein
MINDEKTKQEREIKDKIHREVELAFRNNGFVDESNRFKVKDLLVSTDATLFVKQTIANTVMEAMEPRLVISPLFQVIRLVSGTSIKFPAIGALTAEAIPEGSRYPEKSLDLSGGDQVRLEVTKYGLQVKITQEMIDDSQWDVIGLHLRAAGRALARKKETICAETFNTYGQKVIDNLEKSAAVLGGSSGVDRTGALNGGMHLDNVFEMMAYLVQTGFTPDTIMMHPMAWAMMAKDPLLKQIAWMAGNQYLGGNFSGTQGATSWDSSPNFRMKTINPNAATFQTAIPAGIFPWALKVLVSPYIRFIAKGAAVTKQDGTAPGAVTGITDGSSLAVRPLTDITVLDSSETGVILQKKDVTTDEFDDPERDIKALKIMEMYGTGTLSQGKSVVVARNIAMVPTYDFTNTLSVSSVAEVVRNV